ncbi:MAG: corrinoid protein [Vicinamibacterales bacterium]|jgi:corrinoid protein of di/trimethylamine methyltransferase|nr:corrinoid protein [Vicinamibacterales bacterium]
MADLERLYQAVLNGDAKAAVAVTRQAIDEGMDPIALIQGTMVPAMGEVGKRYEAEDYFLPELLLAARAMKGSLELLRPLLAGRDAASAGRVAIGTVQGDLHDIGKNLVAAMLEGGGFEVIDLGTDVAPGKFVDAIQEQGVQIVALSALLTVTMASMRKTVEALTAAGVRDRVKVMIGGAPVTQEYADEIGADGYSENAASAVALARRLRGTA